MLFSLYQILHWKDLKGAACKVVEQTCWLLYSPLSFQVWGGECSSPLSISLSLPPRSLRNEIAVGGSGRGDPITDPHSQRSMAAMTAAGTAAASIAADTYEGDWKEFWFFTLRCYFCLFYYNFFVVSEFGTAISRIYKFLEFVRIHEDVLVLCCCLSELMNTISSSPVILSSSYFFVGFINYSIPS